MIRYAFAALWLAATTVLAQPATTHPIAPQSPPPPRKVASVEGITEYRFDNGLRLLVFPDPTASTITVNITYLVGSRHEGAGEGGMAHLLEHMVFKGTPRHPNIPQELTERGARPNGTTSYDRTNYFETFNATDENLRWALDLEADRMVNSFIRKQDLDSEFTVVRSEFEAGENNPGNVLFKHAMSTAYTAHAYGRPVIGNRSDVERVPIERLQAFYRQHYQPDNAVLTVAGQVDEDKAVTMVADAFARIPRPARALTPTYTIEPAQEGEREVIMRRIGESQQLRVLYHSPDGAHPDQAALDVLSLVLGGSPSGRLYKALVDTKKATAVAASSFSLAEPGVVMFSATVNQADSLDEARRVLLQEVEGMAQNPPTAAEVERAKARIETVTEQALRDSRRVGLALSEYVALGDWRMMFLARDRQRTVTPADVQRVAAAYFKPSNRTVGLFMPEAKPDRAEIPPRTDVAAAVAGYTGGAGVVQGEAFDPSPANIESRTQRSVLASGAKLSLLPKKTRGQAVQGVISLNFGTREALQGRAIQGEMAAAALMRGTTRYDRQQLQDTLDRLRARMSVAGSADGVLLSFETRRDQVPAVIALAAEMLQRPTFPADEIEQLRRASITAIEGSRSQPQALAGNRLNRALYPYPRGDVRATATLDEKLDDWKALQVDDVRDFHRSFYGASHAQIALVGDFDVAEAKAALESTLGAWKSPQPYRRVEYATEQSASPITERIATPDKANAVYVAGLRLRLRDDDPDYVPLVFGNHLLGGGFLNSRLATRIRVRDGLSYTVSSSIGARSYEADGRFLGQAIAAPQNIDRVDAAFREELARVLKDGYTLQEVDAGRAGWLQSQRVTRSSDASLARLLAVRDEDGRTLQWDADVERRLEQTTPQRISEAMRKHIDPAQLSTVRAGDFGKGMR